jgi:hypothetical protein
MSNSIYLGVTLRVALYIASPRSFPIAVGIAVGFPLQSLTHKKPLKAIQAFKGFLSLHFV